RFAGVGKDDDGWSGKSAKELGYQFKGYRLTPDQRPTFLYTVGEVSVEDFPNALTSKKTGPTIERTLTLAAPKAIGNLWFRAAVADRIQATGGGWFQIDGEWTMRIDSAAPPRIRQAGAKMELLVPVRFMSERARIVQAFAW